MSFPSISKNFEKYSRHSVVNTLRSPHVPQKQFSLKHPTILSVRNSADDSFFGTIKKYGARNYLQKHNSRKGRNYTRCEAAMVLSIDKDLFSLPKIINYETAVRARELSTSSKLTFSTKEWVPIIFLPFCRGGRGVTWRPHWKLCDWLSLSRRGRFERRKEKTSRGKRIRITLRRVAARPRTLVYPCVPQYVSQCVPLYVCMCLCVPTWDIRGSSA